MAGKGIRMYGAGFSGRAVPSEKYPEVKAHCIVDSHMHVQSGSCGPEPLIRCQAPFTTVATTFFSHPLVSGSGGLLSLATCTEIGRRVAEDNTETYKNTEISSEFAVRFTSAEKRERAENRKDGFVPILSPVVIMPMDMEYAHLGGYPDKDGNASTIYHNENNEFFYYKRNSAHAAENQGKKVIIKEKKWKALKVWKQQFKETKDSVLAFAWQQFFLYHYEPRRWRLKEQKIKDDTWTSGTWNDPFIHVATDQHPGICLGFKMYPPLGYKPLDPKLPHLWKYSLPDKSDCFYGKCENEGIPILTHCSPGGMTTNEVSFYAQLEGFDPTIADADNIPEQMKERLASQDWFYFNKFVHPRQWRKVLERFPKLKLCLAHFGGTEWETAGPEGSDWIQEIIQLITEKDGTDPTKFKYPNVYTDVACWDWENSSATEAFKRIIKKKENFQLRKRILFGTDWYMTMIVSPFKSYEGDCKKFKKVIDTFDREGDWFFERLTLLNPFEFFGFGEKAKLFQINSGLKQAGAQVDARMSGYNRFVQICDEVKKIRKDIKKWDEPGPS